MDWLEQLRWDEKGLIPVIAQEKDTGDVLMFAWMNREALQKTAALGRAVYFSRSRGKLWFKGEESGHVQQVHAIRVDCDQDVRNEIGVQPELNARSMTFGLSAIKIPF